MLLQDLYKITSVKKEADNATLQLALNSRHAIFDGHFPGQPVLPGACQVQMLKEILQNILNAEIQLLKAASVKFLSPIVPDDEDILQLDIKYTVSEAHELIVTATIVNKDITCFKFSGTFRIVLHDGW